MAQLLPTPEVRGSNPVNGKLLYRTFVVLLSKDQIKEKEAGNVGSFLKKVLVYRHTVLDEFNL